MTAITALAVVGAPENAVCPTCGWRGLYVARESLLPVPHANGCAALAEERALLRDDLVAFDLGGGAFFRPMDGVEVDLAAALGLDIDHEISVRVEVVDGRRVRVFAVTDSSLVVAA